MNKFFTLLSLLFFSIGISAQPQIGTHFMRNTYQASRTNPALLPDSKLVIALPNFYNHFELTGPSFGDLINTDGATPVFNLGNILNDLDDENSFRNHATLETFGVSVGLGNLRLGLHSASHVGALVNYQKGLAELIWEGNAAFIGETVNIGTGLQIAGYHELGLTGSYKIKMITVGVGLKYLTGVGDISTENSDASLYTDPDVYQLTLNSDFRANSSSFLDFNGIDDYETNFDLNNFGFNNFFSSNSGFALDFGVDVDLGKLKVAASVVDLGSINWTENVRNYTSNGSFEYDGLDFSGAIKGDDTSFEGALDTLSEIFKVTETLENYSTALPQKIYVSAVYDLTDMLQLGASYYNESYQGITSNAISLGAQARLSKMLSVGGNYSIYNDNYANIGLNATGKFGPVQLVLASDNVIGLFDLDNTKYTNFRLGLNLIFGSKKADVMPVDDY